MKNAANFGKSTKKWQIALCAFWLLRTRNFPRKFDFDSKEKLENGYIFLGFVGMSDPPRTGVAEAVKKAQNAGIRVVMLTGDQINTARAVARELNLSEGGEVYALHSRDLTESSGKQIARNGTCRRTFSPACRRKINSASSKNCKKLAKLSPLRATA